MSTDPATADETQAPASVRGVGLSAPRAQSYMLSDRLAVLANPEGIQAESIGVLRTHLITKHLRDGRRSLAVCAPSSAAGSTFIAANLAVALTQTGVKTLLIDGNMRSPGLEEYFTPDQALPGLYQFLSDPSQNPGDMIQNDVQPGLSVMFAGGAAPNAQDLLGGQAFKSLIDMCLRDYDLTICDTPPANRFADSRRIASVLRYALIVTRRNDTYVRDARTLAADLTEDRAQVIGSYLNDY